MAGDQQQELECQIEIPPQFTDFAIAMDYLCIVTQAKFEEEVIDGVVDLFTMLLAPENILYDESAK